MAARGKMFITKSGNYRGTKAAGIALFAALSVLMLPGCKALLEEVTDIRVSGQVPAAGNCGAQPTEIAIQFSSSMDASALTVSTASTACTGNVQVSADDFATCITFSAAAPVTTDNKDFRYTPAPALSTLSANASYKIKVKKDAKTSDGQALANEYISAAGFGSQAQLLITEVGACVYTNRSCWFEIYNKSSQCNANLQDYKIRSTSVDTNGTINTAATKDFTLPSLVLSGGAFLVIRGNAQNSGEYVAGPGQIYILNQAAGAPPDFLPFWTTNGSIEIVKNSNNTTIDFVRLSAASATGPTSGGAASWTNGVFATMPYTLAEAGQSIARNANFTDTNTSTDWVRRTFSTPGAPNDVTCSTDADSDGIPDCSEVAGSTYAGINLYAMGARTGQKDVFIEIDYMDSTDPGVIPQREALDKVKQVFAGRGYKVHFDVGSLYHPAPGISEADHDLGNAIAKVPFAQGVTLGASGDKANLFTYKAGNMDIRRRNIFYYALFGYSQNADGSAGSSGLAEIDGNDQIVTLGNWGLVAGSNKLINYQASTLMHEWGHNLGLYHGGNSTGQNYKPNYFSVMNYMYQLSGLSLLNNNPGDRYYYYRRNEFGDCSLITSMNQLTNNANSATFLMDYSDGSGLSFSPNSLNEASITESFGLYRSGSSPVDYNCNGSSANTGVNKDISGDGPMNSLSDFNDWAAINIIFATKFSGTDSGYFTAAGDEKIHYDPIGNDRQLVIQEHDIPGAREH